MNEEDSLLSLLNGIASKQFLDSASLDSNLKEKFPELSDGEFQKLCERMSQLLRSMASSDMDFNQLDAFLTSQTKRRDSSLTETDAKVLFKFWKTHKAQIHDALIAKSTFNPTLKSLHWRVDVPTQSRTSKHANVPVAIVEMTLRQNYGQEENLDICQFEMDEKGSSILLNTLEDINLQLSTFCKQ